MEASINFICEFRLDNNILICILKNVISNFISNGQFHIWTGVVAFLDSSISPGSFVRIFYHLHQMCVELFTLPHFILSFPMKTTVSSIHLIAAIIIQQSTALSDSPSLGSTYPPKHCSAINAIIIITTYIIRQFHCTNSLGIFSISWVKVINSCQKPTLLKYHGCLRCISKI